MRAQLNKILKDLVDRYDAVPEGDEQSRANALVLIQTATVNLINFNQFELGKRQIVMSDMEVADAKKNGIIRHK